MIKLKAIVLLLSVLYYGIEAGSLENAERQNITKSNLKRFPEDFLFGVATSSYQIEGAWNEGGKGWSMWDHLVRTDPDHIADGSTGDIAANSYHLYKRDVEMLKELGVQIYRFSISWPRILPFGRPDFVNPEGVAHYNKFINELLANDITPFVTIYHWELPQNLNEQGGWLTENITDWFGDYARVLFQNFGDRVKHWMTINEPYVHCNNAYARGNHAPRMRSPGILFYECGRNILLAHARAYHIYKEEFAASQGGRIGVVLSSDMAFPSDDSEASAEAVKDYTAFHLGQYMDPIFSENGNYPQRLIDRVANASARQGLSESRLRPFTQEQIDYIKGTSDFLALNHYTSKYVYRNESLIGTFEVPSHQDDSYFGTYVDPTWPQGASWLFSYPPGLYTLLMHIKETYNNPTIYITENGFTAPEGLLDEPRVAYLRGYMNSVLEALEQGADIRSYCSWSLMDNFEWAMGYTLRFGLYEVDFKDPNRKRTARKSALVYKEIIRSRVIDPDYNPDPYATDSSIIIKTSFIFIIFSATIHSIL